MVSIRSFIHHQTPLRRKTISKRVNLANCSRRDVYTALSNSQNLAALRAWDYAAPNGLLNDRFAAALVQGPQGLDCPSVAAKELPETAAYDIAIAYFIDSCLLQATNMVNVGRKGLEYNQVVLIGDGFCTRPFRLPWPTGTIFYIVAPPEVHERAEAIFSAEKIRVPRGCLLRRVDCDINSGKSCQNSLLNAGYRADRLSIWALQGIRNSQIRRSALNVIFEDMSIMAAFESIMVGELTRDISASSNTALTHLALYGLLGVTFSLNNVVQSVTDEGKSFPLELTNNENISNDECLVFRAQQRRLSLTEMETYEAHVAMAEETDEDFNDNFS